MKTPTLPLADAWQTVETFRLNHLAQHGVPPLPPFRDPPCCEHLALILMFTNYGEAVDKDEAARWIHETAAAHGGSCKLDVQSIRKWPREYGWPIYSGDKGGLDGRGNQLERSQYCMTGTNPPAAWHNKQTRHSSPLACRTFQDLCRYYTWHCAMCGKGGLNRNSVPTLNLEQGHKDPRAQLELANTVPLCQDCNRFQLDSFTVNQQGRLETLLPRPSTMRFFRNLSQLELKQMIGLLQKLSAEQSNSQALIVPPINHLPRDNSNARSIPT